MTPGTALHSRQPRTLPVRRWWSCVASSASCEPREICPWSRSPTYRIVQEATTNILEHSRARHASIDVRRTNNALEITVIDDGDGDAEDANAFGHGLVGIRERVALYGGHVTAGPHQGGGFIVSAQLPRTGA